MLAMLPSLLLILLKIINFTSAQFGGCDYLQLIKFGQSYDIFSPNYPYKNYKPNTACRWTAVSDRPIRVTCNYFKIPQSNLCMLDVVVFRKSSASVERHCGDHTFNITAEKKFISIELYSSPRSPGGQFLCSVEAMNSTTGITPSQPQLCRCGWKNPARIVGGTSTGVNEYPMMAGIVDINKKIIGCGATIINYQQVITAGHCVDGKKPEEIGVLVGEHDLTTGSETNAAKYHGVSQILVHPQYSMTSQDNDIALITVKESIKFNQQVGPACLPIQSSSESFAGKSVNILGWGTLGFGEKRPSVLQKIQVNVINNTDCFKFYKGITWNDLCTYGKDKDSCQFDSGGPVLWQNPTTGRVFLISIINKGGLCDDNQPAINTRVSAYINWIFSQKPAGVSYCVHD